MMDVENAPAVVGLIFRHFCGESDYARIAAVLTASDRADQIERTVTADDIARAYQRLTNCDPYSDIIIAQVASEMVGYARAWWQDQPPTERLYKHNGFLVPEWRRKGIGTAMLLWIERRLHDIAATHPPDPAKFLQVNVAQFQSATAIMLERAGYQPVRCFYETVRPTLDEIPVFPLPNGIEIGPVLPEHYRALWESMGETSRDEWGYVQRAQDDYQKWLTGPHFQPDLWQVAWDTADGEIVGHVLTFIDRDENRQAKRQRGYTEGVGVVRRWRRRGLARALISASLYQQRAAGMSESALAADSQSASGVTRLYESCGFRVCRRDTIYRKSM